MFRFVDAKVRSSTQGTILNMSNVKLFAIVLFLTIVIVVPVAMMRNALKDDGLTREQALLPPAEPT